MLETKTHLNTETIEALHELHATTVGSVGFYEEAAKRAADPVFQGLFSYLANQRRDVANSLASHLLQNQELPERDAPFQDKLHEVWLKMRAMLNAGDAYPLLIEAERAEDRIKNTFERLLIETAGSAMNDVLMEHYATIKKAHDRVRSIRDLAAREGTS